MKLKLDENLGKRGRSILQKAGHDVSAVALQQLGSATDEELIERCRCERRVLVSLDLDFANPLRFRPSQYAGIAVLRLASKPSAADLTNLIRTLAYALTGDSIGGKLWIVESGRVRVYQEPEPE
jgi:predicted nuclease of predicted toxin-antitoxin system